MVRKLRSDAADQRFTCDCGRLKQIFPPPPPRHTRDRDKDRDRALLEKYLKLLQTACSLYQLPASSETHEVQRFLVRKVHNQNINRDIKSQE